MSERPRWITAPHRGLYIHALAFQLADSSTKSRLPGPKWGYLVAVGRSAVPSVDSQYDGDGRDECDYFTRDSAEQAALHFGQRIADVILEFE
ncbi:hypothetical protein [Cupriavidus pauculus]|uniref:hypothetical protein n=1 Tax=Cupriavidus pauculus TaxID=82633 RepID=UPI001EE2439F|nr:hypothetical protein [Cupriavidus pauculus]GJG96781.1 hypothetical protein CBA19C6_19850 [Cupriavidus pauculus]